MPGQLLCWVQLGKGPTSLEDLDWLAAEAKFLPALDYCQDNLLELDWKQCTEEQWEHHLKQLFSCFGECESGGLESVAQEITGRLQQSEEVVAVGAWIHYRLATDGSLPLARRQVAALLLNTYLIQHKKPPFWLGKNEVESYSQSLAESEQALQRLIEKNQECVLELAQQRRMTFKSYQSHKPEAIKEEFFQEFPEYLGWYVHPGGSGEGSPLEQVAGGAIYARKPYQQAEAYAKQHLLKQPLGSLRVKELEQHLIQIGARLNGVKEIAYRKSWITVDDYDKHPDLQSVVRNRQALQDWLKGEAAKSETSFDTKMLDAFYAKLEKHGSFDKAAPYLEEGEWEVLRHVAYVAPAPDKVARLMKEFVQELVQRASEEDFEPVALAAWAHHRLVKIHPFGDANGRTARLLMNVILMQGRHAPVAFSSDRCYTEAVNQGEDAFGRYLGEEVAYTERRKERHYDPVFKPQAAAGGCAMQ